MELFYRCNMKIRTKRYLVCVLDESPRNEGKWYVDIFRVFGFSLIHRCYIEFRIVKTKRLYRDPKF